MEPAAQGVVLVNPFVVPEDKEKEFVELWSKTAERFRSEPGFLDTRLHRSKDASARFRFVNVAHWSSAAAWEAAMKKAAAGQALFERQLPVEANPALYDEVVRLTAPGKPEDEVRAVMDGFRKALVGRDGPFLERTLADDYTFTTPVGTVLTKAQRVQAVASGARPVESLEYHDLTVKLIGDAAIVAGLYVERAPGAKDEERGRLLNVFARGPAGWQMVASQNVRVAKP